ncbi:MAG: RNA-binding transcriptional accessory protein [Pseudomonadota bacterium]|nr:RNA-binding transcriptional accessory protein [Pseudomonadota bacterium]
MDIAKSIATTISAREQQVTAAIALLDDGATVPFISRYRKEVTGGLDDTQLRELEQQLRYLRELEERRDTILNSIKEQEKLTPELERAILAADNKASLEDLYLPYKPKRRTKAQIAREAGLEPLAEQLLADPTIDPLVLAFTFLNPEHSINDAETALEGARQILMEKFSEHAELLGKLRETVWQYGVIESTVAKDKEVEGKKFADYFDYKEPINKIPSHRALALFRGRSENMLRLALTLTDAQHQNCSDDIAQTFEIRDQKRAADKWLQDTVQKTWRIKILLSLELDLMTRLKQQAEEEAIHVFADNLKNLLMMAPAGNRVTMGLDPGLRTGVKVVVLDETGKLVVHTTIFPHVPRNDWEGSLKILEKLTRQCKVELVSIGNGTASRETDKLIADLIKRHPDLKLIPVVVSEAGASVYSASEFAAKEFPDLDVSIRGAVSIARRLQDPLAELVKIDPKSIGVGQYQHDVNQTKLGRSLQAVMEDCVNAVGVDINMASVPLLTSVAGLNETLAKNIVAFRDSNGRFTDRITIKKVPGLGDKRFQQAAGFLRITNGANPLDASAVHPEAYPVVERILAKEQKKLNEIMGNTALLRSLKAEEFTDTAFGVPTVTDIISELDKPGRDPRPEFKTAKFKEGVDTLKDVKPGMILEGVVTNVANFGAFVDIGVHQDGLVHISQLTDHFIKDPKEVVKVGQIVTVKVIEVDPNRNRISLTCRLNETPEQKESKMRGKPPTPQQREAKPKPQEQPQGTMAAAFAAALKR